jgi:hypothetical protein
MIIGFAQWPIAHNQILRYDPKRIIKSYIVAVVHNNILRNGPQIITKACAVGRSVEIVTDFYCRASFYTVAHGP